MDFSGFKKISASQHTTTLKHPHGHKIVIAHAALSPDIKKKLAAIPQHFDEGGSVDKTPQVDVAKAKDMVKGAQSSGPSASDAWKNIKTEVGSIFHAKGGTVEPVESADQDEVERAALGAAEVQNSHPELKTEESPKFPSYAEGGEVGHGATASWEPDADPGPATVPQPPATDMYGNYLQNTGNAIEQEKQANTDIGNAQAQGAQQTANIEGQNAQAVQQQMQAHQQAFNDLNNERAAFIDDVKSGHIDPDQYLHDMGTGKKIRTAIGLLLGGFSGGNGSANPAAQFLNAQIDRNIQGQLANLNSKQNLLHANLQQFGNINDATNMSRIQQNDYVKSLVNQAAAASQSPIAKAQAQKFNADLDQKTAMLQSQIAISKSRPGSQSMGSLPPEMMDPKMRERFVPGRGIALTKEDANKMKESEETISPIMSQLDKLDALGASALVPGSPANQSAKAIQASLIPMLNENAGLKRLTHEDIELMQKMVSDPTSFRQLAGGPARSNQLRQLLRQKIDASNGVRLSIPMQGNQQSSSGFKAKSFKPSK